MVVILMKISKLVGGCLLSVCALWLSACPVAQKTEGGAKPQPSPWSTPPPDPLITYLYQGNLWVVKADGTDARQLAAAAEGETINAHTWSLDGSKSYFNLGLKLYSVSIATGKIEEAGELAAPPGTTIDRLEMGRDGTTLLVFALAPAAELTAGARLLALTLGRREARELTVDEYSALAPLQPVVVRTLSDLSVSPDGRWVLFKEVIGSDEQMFVSDLETGVRYQVGDLGALEGFEESATLDGGRRILEATWSPDGNHVIFNPAQSCSELGLCYGRLYLVNIWSGVSLQLSRELMLALPTEWERKQMRLLYDDSSQVLLADTRGQIRRLGEGNQPRWQPIGH